MLDRESTFAEPAIVKMLQQQFVPVAIDQAYQRRQKDTEGDFYRQIAGQGPRNNFRGTTQGFYIATAAGKLLLYNNNRDPQKIRRLMQQKLREFRRSGAGQQQVAKVERRRVDARYNPRPPRGGLVVRVRAKVLAGYAPTTNRWRKIMHNALSRDNLWVSAKEHQSLVRGKLPASLQMRIARFHLIDNTRGEPSMWRTQEVRKMNLAFDGQTIRGQIHLRTENGKRGYEADILGQVVKRKGKVVRFDLVAHGKFWGECRYTRGAPKGKFPFAIAFTLADMKDVADRVPPQGSRGWLQGYLRRSD